MHLCTVRRVIARAGDALGPGTPLLELRVDLDEANARDCPAMYFVRMIATERAHLRALALSAGDVVLPSAPLGVASTSSEETLDRPPTRALRTTCVSIPVDPLST